MMVEHPCFFAEDKRFQPIMDKMEGIAYECHQYNRHLADHLRQSIDGHPRSHLLDKNLKICHFRQFSREIIEDEGIDWDPPKSTRELADFFVEDVPDLIEQAACLAMDEGEEIQYEAIVMDEVQDFHSRWWEVLQ